MQRSIGDIIALAILSLLATTSGGPLADDYLFVKPPEEPDPKEARTKVSFPGHLRLCREQKLQGVR